MSVSEEATAGIAVETRATRLRRMWEGISIVFASKTALIGLVIVMFWVLVAVFAPFLTPYTPLEQDWKAPNQGPSTSHILGTDELGRDLWSRLIHGARVVLVVLPLSGDLWIPGGTAIWGVFAALIVGMTLGLVSGYYGGWLDEVVMRLLDAMMAVPIILLYLIIMAALGASAVNVVIAITIVGTPGIARLVRSLTLDIRTREYIRAAETRGENPWYIMFVEILPNARGPIIVDAMLRVGYAIFALSTADVMRFLGRKVPKLYQGEVVSDYKDRPEGVRVKHRVGVNSVKVYDKEKSILRVETTMNDPKDFKVFRPKQGDENGSCKWRSLRKGVADIHRRAKVSDASNDRYLDALAAVSNDAPLKTLFHDVAMRTTPVSYTHLTLPTN